MQQPILYRNAEPTDHAFLYNSYLKSYRNSPQTTHLSNEIYFSYHKALFASILQTSTLLVACDPEDPDNIFGWIAYSNEMLHYVYVKYIFRRLGIAKELLQSAPNINTMSHYTHASKKLFSNKPITFNPYVVVV